MGEYLPYIHNCREETCSFTEPLGWLQRLSLETGETLPDSALSPRDHMHVDKRACTEDVHVKVPLDLLGYDQSLRGDLSISGAWWSTDTTSWLADPLCLQWTSEGPSG